MITLWPISIEDTGFMLDLVHDPETTKYVPGLILKEDEMRAWIEGIQPEDHEFIVLADGVPIGECSLTVYGCSAEVGFMLLPQYWRHGYGTDMLRQLLNLAEE